MATKPRLNRLTAQAQKRHETARAEYHAWWVQFSTAELKKIAAGDKTAIARCYGLGYERIAKLSRYALTPKEKNELKKIKKDLMKRGNQIAGQPAS